METPFGVAIRIFIHSFSFSFVQSCPVGFTVKGGVGLLSSDPKKTGHRICPATCFMEAFHKDLQSPSASVRPVVQEAISKGGESAEESLPTLSSVAWRLCVSSSSSECPPSSPLGRTSVQLALSLSSGSSKATVIELSLSQFALLLAEAEKAQAVVEG